MLTDREQFLLDVMTTAIENYGYGWFNVQQWVHEVEDADAVKAVIVPEDPSEHDEPDFTITLDTIRKGFERIAAQAPALDILDSVHGEWAARMLRAYADVDEGAGDIDVADALWVLEWALFGEAVYA